MIRQRAAVAAGLLAAACLANAASAQEAGTYSGTAADGSTISFVVATDTATGKLQITAFNFGFADTCSPGAFAFNSGWGLPGQSVDLKGAKTVYKFDFPYVDVTATIDFSGSSASGTITNVTPTLVAPAVSGAMSRKAAFCHSAKQSYTATVTAAAAIPQGRLMQGYVFTDSLRHN